MRFWVGVSAAFGAGTLVGIVAGALIVEDKLKKEYADSAASYRRAMEAARIDAETPALNEEALFVLPHDKEGQLLEGGEITRISEVVSKDLTKEDVAPLGENPYHTAVQATSAQSIYASFAELEEEEYYEEDGRVKDQITMVFDDGVARFFNEGEEIEDAFERVGGTIVDDMRAAVGEGNPILYIRNNQTEVDYEVLFEQP